jgi:hypothetical protein
MAIVLDGTNGVTTNSGTLISATTIGVGGATPSTSGAGITFPATQSASSDANTLDDYEEGTWTPTIAFGGNSVGVTYSQQKGNYTKIGNRVFISMYLELSNKGSSTGNITLGGLPFTSNSTTFLFNNFAVWVNSASSLSGSMQGYNSPNTSTIQSIGYVGTGSQTTLTNSNINNNTDFMINFSYSV